MPTLNVSVYLTDEEMVKTIKHKDKILDFVRKLTKKEIGKLK